MDLDLSPEQQDFQKTVRSFVDDVIRPNAERWDQEHELPMTAVSQMAELGLFGLPFPEEYGGSDADFLTLCLAIEEIARVDSSLAITLEAAVGLGAMPIFRFGTTEQKAKWLPSLAAGESLAGFGLTEPGAGSDAGATVTTGAARPRRVGDQRFEVFHHELRQPHHFLRDRSPRSPASRMGTRRSLRSWFRPERQGSPWLRLIARWAGGIRTPTSCRSTIARCPKTNLLGERGEGFRNFLKILDDGRIAIAALAVGLAQGCLDESLKYVHERSAFGKPIGSFQALQFKIADMACRPTSRVRPTTKLRG